MSATIETPRGLDTLTAEDQRLMESMRDDTAAVDEPAASEPAAPALPATETTEDFEIELPEATPAVPEPRQTTVPQQALHAEREKRKAAEKLAAEREVALATVKTEREKEQAVLQARLDMLAAAMRVEAPAPAVATAAPVAEEPIPDENTDPIGHFKALNRKLERTVETQGAILTGLTEQQRLAQQASELRNWGIAQEQAFAASEPAYAEAMAWLQKSRHDELTAIGIADPAERQKIINGDVTSIAVNAKNAGANFAERLFRAAQTRGWQKKAPTATAPLAEQPVIPPLEVTAPAVVDPDARAARVAAGRENSITIGSLGSAPPARLSVEKIANMSEADFAKFITRFEGNPNALRDLMGH
jgi:hypothetical protein